jgi:CRISPR type I-E-associated protein CasA/Cse1
MSKAEAQTSLSDAAALPWVVSPGAKPLAGASHPLLPLFAAPRRILLSPPTTEGRCDLTGVEGPLVTHFREGQRGPEYAAGGFSHPWTPCSEKIGKPPAPILAGSRPTSFGWRDWLGFVARRLDGTVSPAAAVSAWNRARLTATIGRTASLRVAAYGVRCAQAKVLGYVRSTHTFDVVADEHAARFQAALNQAVAGVERMSLWLVSAVREVVNDGSKKRVDQVERQIQGRSDALWTALEGPGADFSHRTAQALEADNLAEQNAARKDLYEAACRVAVRVFDDAVTVDAILQPDVGARAANARGRLTGSLYGKPGRTLFAVPDPPKAAEAA